jgi:hypothetical protein
MTKAEMDAGAERDMPVRPPLEIELLGTRVGVRIEVRGRPSSWLPLSTGAR